jgi:hypothetical protein
VQLFADDELLQRETKCSRIFRTICMVQEHLKMFAQKFQVSYLSFCTVNEGESTTIKKKEKVCNTAQQLNIAISFFNQI